MSACHAQHYPKRPNRPSKPRLSTKKLCALPPCTSKINSRCCTSSFFLEPFFHQKGFMHALLTGSAFFSLPTYSFSSPSLVWPNVCRFPSAGGPIRSFETNAHNCLSADPLHELEDNLLGTTRKEPTITVINNKKHYSPKKLRATLPSRVVSTSNIFPLRLELSTRTMWLRHNTMEDSVSQVCIRLCTKVTIIFWPSNGTNDELRQPHLLGPPTWLRLLSQTLPSIVSASGEVASLLFTLFPVDFYPSFRWTFWKRIQIGLRDPFDPLHSWVQTRHPDDKDPE